LLATITVTNRVYEKMRDTCRWKLLAMLLAHQPHGELWRRAAAGGP